MGITAIVGIVHICFVIVSLKELFSFKYEALRYVVLSPSSLAAISFEIAHVSIAVVLSNNSHRLSAPPKNTFIVKHMAKRSVMKETIIQDI